MKRKLIHSVCWLIAIAVAIASLTLPACAKRRFGDVDGDGEISSADARLTLRASVSLETLSLEQIMAADMDGDGYITSADARTILRASVSLEVLPQVEVVYPEPHRETDDFKVALITDFGEITDGGYNQVSYEACRGFCSANDVELSWFKPYSDSDEDRVAMIEAAIDSGCNVLVLPGYTFGQAIKETAGKYPKVYFIALDVSAGDLGEDYRIPGNVCCTVYREELAGFMAGYAAVQLGYRRLGFLGGMAVPAVIRYGYGFIQGADAAAAELKLTNVSVNYGYGNQFYGDADITDVMKTWYWSGTQVIFACGGGIYTSVVDAAKTIKSAKIIGVDTDQAANIAQYASFESGSAGDYMDLTVTSAMKGLAPTVRTMLTAVISGDFGKYGGKVEILGLVSENPEENYVQLAGSTQFDGNFTYDDYAALTARLFNGALAVSDDITRTAGDCASVISVVDFGNIK